MPFLHIFIKILLFSSSFKLIVQRFVFIQRSFHAVQSCLSLLCCVPITLLVMMHLVNGQFSNLFTQYRQAESLKIAVRYAVFAFELIYALALKLFFILKPGLAYEILVKC